jgi:hypothetical protein
LEDALFRVPKTRRMKIRTSRHALTTGAAAALLAACSGSQQLPAGAMVDPSGSWVAPDAASSALLYVSDLSQLSVYTYPKGQLVGVIRNSGFSRPAGECVDASGDVFVASLENGKIYEYAHGSRQLRNTLDAPNNDRPIGCAVDPTTGNLAVASQPRTGTTAGSVAIYAQAQGSPQVYVDHNIRGYFFCGYDDNGNLFIDGRSSEGAFRFAELPAGSSQFVDIKLNQKIRLPGSVLWDGTYIAVGDQSATDLYEFSIKGSRGTLVRTTQLDEPKGVSGDSAFWIAGTRILVAEGARRVGFYAYPAGGNAIRNVSKDVRYPLGLTVSLAP